mgnify:CR=1 FL=1
MGFYDLTEDEQRLERLKEFHQASQGHRRYKTWPDVPKRVLDLAMCETPGQHVLKEHSLTLADRPHPYRVLYCAHCPVAFVDPIVPTPKKP